MREAIAIAFAVCLWVYVWNASSFDLQEDIQKSLRPIAIQINKTQATISSTQRNTILEELITAKQTTTNHYTRLALGKLITKVQTVVDSDLDSAPATTIVNALANTYTN